MKKRLFLCAAALFFLCPFPVWGGGDLEMHVIDVGQGCVFRRKPPRDSV